MLTRDSEPVQILFGALMVLLLVVVIGYSYGRDRLATATSGGYELSASFNRVDGLIEGAEVHLSGVRVGTVVRKDLDSNYRAQVVMLLDRRVALPTDSSAAIHTDGLFGSKYVLLEPGGDEDILQPGDHFDYTQDAVVVEELLELIIAEGRARLGGAGAAPDK